MSLDSPHLVMPGLWSQASRFCMLVLQLSGQLLPPPAGPGGGGVGDAVVGGAVALPHGGLLVLVQVAFLPLVGLHSSWLVSPPLSISYM